MRMMLTVLAITGLLGACASQPSAAGVATTAPAAAGDVPTVANAVTDYRLGPGDKVRVIVFGEQQLTGEFIVSGGGTISFPLVGAVKAQGVTVPEFQEALRSKLADGYLRDPKVSAEVLAYRPFYILGEVQKPGEYPYTNGLTVLNAVATAGGFTYRANSKQVVVRRAGASAEVSVPLTADAAVAPGDTIRVKERFF